MMGTETLVVTATGSAHPTTFRYVFETAVRHFDVCESSRGKMFFVERFGVRGQVWSAFENRAERETLRSRRTSMATNRPTPTPTHPDWLSLHLIVEQNRLLAGRAPGYLAIFFEDGGCEDDVAGCWWVAREDIKNIQATQAVCEELNLHLITLSPRDLTVAGYATPARIARALRRRFGRVRQPTAKRTTRASAGRRAKAAAKPDERQG